MSSWTKIIKPKRNLLEIDFRSIWAYRDLIRMFVKRDYVTFYKQTILGPIWFFIQPAFNALINYFVFGKLAGIGPEGVPGFLFYLSGPILWQYFQESFTKTAGTFKDNQNVFGKVYFPRLIMPLSIVLSSLMKFFIQLGILFVFIMYYYVTEDFFAIDYTILYLPLLVFLMMLLALGSGLVISSLTTKYRDLKFIVDFGVPLLKYITPGIATSYSIFVEKMPEMSWVAKYNPIGHILDAFNAIFTGAGEISFARLGYSFGFTLVVLIFGVIIFNQTEKAFMDTV